MIGNDLDMYIATFDHLWDTTQWKRDLQGTILLFWQGLNPALAQAVINWTISRPQTFDEWANMACCYAQVLGVVNVVLCQ
jgi:hypothetical protein